MLPNRRRSTLFVVYATTMLSLTTIEGTPALRAAGRSALDILAAPPCQDFKCLCSKAGIDSMKTLKIIYIDPNGPKVRNPNGPPVNSRCKIGFQSGGQKEWMNKLHFRPQSMTWKAASSSNADEEWYRGYDRVAFAHELGHAMGLKHEHQRPGSYDLLAGATAPLQFHPEHIPGYFDVMNKVTGASDTAFQGLLPVARVLKLFQDRDMIKKYWKDARPWTVEDHATTLSGINSQWGGDFDFNSVMLYSGWQGVKPIEGTSSR
nr:hypothetical protein B0A51_10244 [Rachicladosporium sp. CCFEE 5018]